jgi:hypothetical protein
MIQRCELNRRWRAKRVLHYTQWNWTALCPAIRPERRACRSACPTRWRANVPNVLFASEMHADRPKEERVSRVIATLLVFALLIGAVSTLLRAIL